MPKNRLPYTSNICLSANSRNASAMLLVLMVVAIIMILSVIQIKTLFKTPPKPSKPITDINRPWLESDRILDQDRLISLPEAPKPLLSKPIRIVADVRREGNPRGRITLEFADNGEVSGKWGCSYAYEQSQYSYTAGFKGNIDIEATYVDQDNKKDESKLFFITKGTFTKTTANQTSGISSDTDGDVYVTGWLGPDHSAQGRITITTDETWSAVYTWNGGPK